MSFQAFVKDWGTPPPDTVIADRSVWGVKVTKPKHTAGKTSDRIPVPLKAPIDFNLQKLTINSQSAADMLGDALIDGTLSESMDQSSQVVLQIHDKQRALVKNLLQAWAKYTNNPTPQVTSNTNKRGRKVLPQARIEVDLELDGRLFAMASPEKQGDEYTLTFENKGIHMLRQYNTPEKWNRASFTRAMAILAMIQEVKGFHIPYYIPELHKVEPIAASTDVSSGPSSQAALTPGVPTPTTGTPTTTNPTTTPSTTPTTTSPAPSGLGRITVKGVPASPQQISIINTVLRTGASMNAPYAVLVMSIMCITQESDVTLLNDPNGYGPFSQLRNGAWPASVTDVAADAAAFFKLCIPAYTSNPSQSYTLTINSVQRSAFPDAYAQWQTEAEHTVQAFGVTSTSNNLSSTDFTPVTTPPGGSNSAYYFARGDAGQDEDSWTAIQRLAQEVGWHAFFVDNTFYYVEDNQLLAQMPRDIISESQLGIDSIDWTYNVGEALNEVTVLAHVDRWKSPPGSVVIIEDDGVADGKWIVRSIDWPLFGGNAVEITLGIPQAPLPEPAPSSSGSTSIAPGTTPTLTHGAGPTPSALGVSSGTGAAGGASTSGAQIVSAAYNEAQSISNAGLPYTWGGGHASFAPAPGYDCSGYVSAILHAAGVLSSPEVSGSLESWGQPGPGNWMTVWAASNHVFIEFKLPSPWGHCQANTSYPGAHGPLLLPWGSNGATDAASGTFVARHWPGT